MNDVLEVPDIVTVTDDQTEFAKKWVIIFYNDEVTPFEFVMALLINVFKYDNEQAYNITKKIHNTRGDAVWVGSLEVGELRYEQVKDICKMFDKNEFKFELKEE